MPNVIEAHSPPALRILMGASIPIRFVEKQSSTCLLACVFVAQCMWVFSMYSQCFQA